MGNSGRGKRLKILLDTNMLLALGEGINIFNLIEEFLDTKPEYIIIKPVHDELVKLASSGRPIVRKKAKLALKIIEDYCTIVEYQYDSSKPVDDLIIEFAETEKIPVATNDKELRKKLRKKGIPQIYLRDKNIIESDINSYMLI